MGKGREEGGTLYTLVRNEFKQFFRRRRNSSSRRGRVRLRCAHHTACLTKARTRFLTERHVLSQCGWDYASARVSGGENAILVAYSVGRLHDSDDGWDVVMTISKRVNAVFEQEALVIVGAETTLLRL